MTEDTEEDDGVIAFVMCQYRESKLAKRYQPSWVRLLDGERILTVHQANAWVMGAEQADEVAANCNSDPDWQSIVMRAGQYSSDPLPVEYTVVKYRLIKE